MKQDLRDTKHQRAASRSTFSSRPADCLIRILDGVGALAVRLGKHFSLAVFDE